MIRELIGDIDINRKQQHKKYIFPENIDYMNALQRTFDTKNYSGTERIIAYSHGAQTNTVLKMLGNIDDHLETKVDAIMTNSDLSENEKLELLKKNILELGANEAYFLATKMTTIATSKMKDPWTVDYLLNAAYESVSLGFRDTYGHRKQSLDLITRKIEENSEKLVIH